MDRRQGQRGAGERGNRKGEIVGKKRKAEHREGTERTQVRKTERESGIEAPGV